MRATFSGCERRKPAVNQRSITAGATARMPSRRTSSMRECHCAAGGMCAEVLQSTNRATRSGRCEAAHMAVMPPRDNPHQCAFTICAASRTAIASCARISMEHFAAPTPERP